MNLGANVSRVGTSLLVFGGPCCSRYRSRSSAHRYGPDRDEALAGVQALALRVLAELLENRETPAEFLNVTFQAA